MVGHTQVEIMEWRKRVVYLQSDRDK